MNFQRAIKGEFNDVIFLGFFMFLVMPPAIFALVVVLVVPLGYAATKCTAIKAFGRLPEYLRVYTIFLVYFLNSVTLLPFFSPLTSPFKWNWMFKFGQRYGIRFVLKVWSLLSTLTFFLVSTCILQRVSPPC